MLRRKGLAALLLLVAACAPPARVTPPAVTPAALTAENLAAPQAADALLAEGFVALGVERGLQVYRRERLPGIELAAEGNLGAPPDQARRMLLDYPRHRAWQTHLAENRILARGPDQLDVYQRLNLPIIDDRDFTLHVTWGNDGDVLWMRFVAANDRGPAAVPGVVRVMTDEGTWRLTPVDGGRATHALFRFHMDLAGSVPSWMGKGQATDDLRALFVKMQGTLADYR